LTEPEVIWSEKYRVKPIFELKSLDSISADFQANEAILTVIFILFQMILDPKAVRNSGTAKIIVQTEKMIDSEKMIEMTGKITAQTGIKAEGIKKIKTDTHRVKTTETMIETRATVMKDSLTNQEIINFQIDNGETIRIDQKGDSTDKTTTGSKKTAIDVKKIQSLPKRKETRQNEAQAGAIRAQNRDQAQEIANLHPQKLRKNHHSTKITTIDFSFKKS
jgi:hypothetical protein